MRLDHIAYRTIDRVKTAEFFIKAFGYKIQTEFDLEFDDKSTTKCIALAPVMEEFLGWTNVAMDDYARLTDSLIDSTVLNFTGTLNSNQQQPFSGVEQPELFVSDGSPDSIVGKWVAERGNIGGIHHIAYQVDSVHDTMREWQTKGWATFASTSPLECPGLTQVFTTPHQLTGVIYEFIERKGEFGFCAENVKKLMLSTKEL